MAEGWDRAQGSELRGEVRLPREHMATQARLYTSYCLLTQVGVALLTV